MSVQQEALCPAVNNMQQQELCLQPLKSSAAAPCNNILQQQQHQQHQKGGTPVTLCCRHQNAAHAQVLMPVQRQREGDDLGSSA